MRPLRLEIARTPAQRARGLMHRRHLAPDAGMVFVYDRVQPRCMWMKNTYIPLDMLFLDSHGVVTDVIENTVPESTWPYCSRGPAQYVVELRAGTARRRGLGRGSRMRFRG